MDEKSVDKLADDAYVVAGRRVVKGCHPVPFSPAMLPRNSPHGVMHHNYLVMIEKFARPPGSSCPLFVRDDMLYSSFFSFLRELRKTSNGSTYHTKW